jgi:hypothetical protein
VVVSKNMRNSSETWSLAKTRLLIKAVGIWTETKTS